MEGTIKFIVRLTVAERAQVEGLVNRGKVGAEKRKRANILLKADASPEGPAWSDSAIATAIGVVTDERTSADLAVVLRVLADVTYAAAAKIVLVMDNLNTHKLAVLYQVYPPEEARRLWGRFEIHYTPKHASWLNMAETELSGASCQCLNRRIADKDFLRTEVAASEEKRNQADVKVDWQFTTADARIKLKRLYPTLEVVN